MSGGWISFNKEGNAKAAVNLLDGIVPWQPYRRVKFVRRRKLARENSLIII